MVPDKDYITIIIRSNLESLSMSEEKSNFEEMSQILSILSVFRLPNGALISRVFIANLSQDIKEFTKILPRLPLDWPIIILKKTSK
jgi:hypothetical protein